MAGTSRDIDVVDIGPGLFYANGSGSGPGAILNASGKLVTEANPARPGDIVALYATGLGRLTDPVPSGNKPPEPPPQTVAKPEVRIAGRPATVRWSGAAPGLVGVSQMNVQIPADAPSGVQPVRHGCTASGGTALPVQQASRVEGHAAP